jgi:hypothetical protein
MAKDDPGRTHERWAHLRFSIVGRLLAAPPERGALREEIRQLAGCEWRHPVTGRPVRFGASTIERWYYAARAERIDPVGVLQRRVRKDSGLQPSITDRLRRLLDEQYRRHRRWSYKLHRDNLLSLARQDVTLQPVPSYATLFRYMRSHGMLPQKRRGPRDTPGAALARIYPLDKTRNADGRRRSLDPPAVTPVPDEDSTPDDGMAPLLRELIREYAATGLPPAYLSKEES